MWGNRRSCLIAMTKYRKENENDVSLIAQKGGISTYYDVTKENPYQHRVLFLEISIIVDNFDQKTGLTINLDNATQHGKDTAAGKVGTGWMAFSPDAFCEAMAQNGSGLADKFETYARGWLETDQWQYEVGDNFSVSLIEDMEDAENEWMDIQSAWILGYVEYMLESKED